MRTAPLLTALAALALTGCGKADNEPGPGGVSVGEAKALDEAAEILEAQRPPVTPPPASPAPAEPAPAAPSPAK